MILFCSSQNIQLAVFSSCLLVGQVKNFSTDMLIWKVIIEES